MLTVDTTKFVLVNRQNRPVTVYDRNRRQVRVAPISLVQKHGTWDRNGVYVLTDPFYAQYVGPQGPLYLMPRADVEARMGADFPADGEPPRAGQNRDATPVGESVVTQAARVRAVGAGAPVAPRPPTPVATAAPAPEAPDDDETVELRTYDELAALKIGALRAYAANWDIRGGSKQALLDQLEEAECVAPPED